MFFYDNINVKENVFFQSASWERHCATQWREQRGWDVVIFDWFVLSMRMQVKPRPNDRNMPTQHIATLLGATCCVRLATLLRHVATCWVLLAQIWPVSNLSKQQPTCRNMSQHGGQTHSTCWAQQCCDMLCGMLRSFGRGFILDSSFARPGSAPIWGGKKGEFRDWTRGRFENWLLFMF